MKASKANARISSAHKTWLKDRIKELKGSEFEELIAIISQEIKVMPTADLTTREYESQLKLLRRHLKKASRSIKALEQSGKGAELDLSYFLANGEGLVSLVEKNAIRTYKHDCGVSVLTDCLLRAIDHKLAEKDKGLDDEDDPLFTAKPHSRTHRPLKTQNAQLIIAIADFFEKNLPSRVVSSSPGTVFSDVINFIISDVLGNDGSNFKRQIDHALQWKKATAS